MFILFFEIGSFCVDQIGLESTQIDLSLPSHYHIAFSYTRDSVHVVGRVCVKVRGQPQMHSSVVHRGFAVSMSHIIHINAFLLTLCVEMGVHTMAEVLQPGHPTCRAVPWLIVCETGLHWSGG